MKKVALFVLVLAFSICTVVSDGFSQQSKQPQRGGVLRIIAASSPRVVGYYPEMGPNESTATLPGIERLMRLTPNREFEPFLAESIKVDEKSATVTIQVRKGVKFHDGSALDADVVAWNLRLLIDSRKITYGDKIKAVEVADKYTVVLRLAQYNNLMLGNIAWAPILSKAAFETKGKDWVRMNLVGTGPFKLVDWKRDNYLKWERFADYWQKGLPYYDGVEVKVIPDPVTASAMMESKQADVWLGSPVQYQSQLDRKGIKRQSYWPGTPNFIYINTKNSASPLANQKVREAIEYALDKNAIAKALGYGYYSPMNMIAPPGEYGYDPDYKGRTYDPEKAKKLLAEAGYSKGVRLKLLAMQEMGGRNTIAEALKTYLDQVGFNIDIDIADSGRFFNSLWVNGWDDLAVYITGIDETYLATIQYWFGPEPRTVLQSLKMPAEFLDLCTRAQTYRKAEEQKAAAKKLVRIVADQALIIPVYFVPVAYNVQPWVHMDYYRNGFPWWKIAENWMEKH
jgi:peptide/nickel transport system substrate-binding protein